MDLKLLKLSDSFVHNVQIDGVPINGMTVTLRNKYSPEWKARVSELAMRLQELKKDEASYQYERDKINAELLEAAVCEWDGFEEDGKKLDCTPDVVRRVLTEHEWLREQIDRAVGSTANFLPSAAKALLST